MIVDFSIGKVEALQICQNLRKNNDFTEIILIALLPDDGQTFSFDRSAINETFRSRSTLACWQNVCVLLSVARKNWSRA